MCLAVFIRGRVEPMLGAPQTVNVLLTCHIHICPSYGLPWPSAAAISYKQYGAVWRPAPHYAQIIAVCFTYRLDKQYLQPDKYILYALSDFNMHGLCLRNQLGTYGRW